MRRPLAAALAALVLAAIPAAGQQVVELPGRDRPLDLEPETLWRVGSFDGEAWETFGSVRDVGFDGAGTLYVLDSQAFRVVVIDREGRLVREMGRAGDGPGELRSPTGMAVMRDGTVAVADMGHRAFVVYGPDGKYRHAVSFAGPGEITVLGELLADPRGGAVIAAGRRVVAMRRDRPGEAPPDPGHPVVRYELDADGGRRALLEAWRPPAPEGSTGVDAAGMRLRMPVERAFEPGLFAGALPDGGIAFSDSSDYAVKIAGPDGGVGRVLRRPIAPRETTGRLERAERERRLAELESGAGQVRIALAGPDGGAAREVPPAEVREMMRRRIDALVFYPEVPVVQALATGWRGKVWVRRRGPDLLEDGPVDVLDPAAGAYLGTFEAATPIPSAFGPGGLAAYVEVGELDVPTVVVRRLPAALR